jgi:hypothetical protein
MKSDFQKMSMAILKYDTTEIFFENIIEKLAQATQNIQFENIIKMTSSLSFDYIEIPMKIDFWS